MSEDDIDACISAQQSPGFTAEHVGVEKHISCDIGASSRRLPRGQGSGKPSGESSSELIEAFGLFRSYFDTQLGDLKKEIASKTTVSKQKDSIHFKKFTHRYQYEFNAEVQEGLESILSHSSDSSFVRKTAKELLGILHHRNKLIRVADSSPGGWATVKEYEVPLLGSDSEDEKKLKQAESRAVKKLKTANAKYTVSRVSSSDFMRNPAQGGRYTAASSSTGGFQQALDNRQLQRKMDPSAFFRGSRYATPRDICFGCGKSGHFRRECVIYNNIKRSPDSAAAIYTNTATATAPNPASNK